MKNKKLAIAALVTCSIVLLVAAIASISTSMEPTKRLFKDSGILGCEALRDSMKNQRDKSDDKLTQPQYDKFRRYFANSRYVDLRDSGTRFIDLIWQVDNFPASQQTGASIAFGGQIMQDWSSLSGSCLNHGIELPTLSGR